MSKTIEDVLKKHRVFTAEKEAHERVTAAMQEWAALQTPSNEKYGWVKASERLPEKRKDDLKSLSIHVVFRAEGRVYYGYHNGIQWVDDQSLIYSPIPNVDDWLDESTPIPLTPCGWTKVEDGLPDDKQLCLVFNSISVEPSVYDRNEFYRYPNDVSGDRCAVYYFDKSKVTHWMPLPTKPNL